MKDLNTIEKLTEFVNQKPRLNPTDYNDSQSYNSESRAITRDRNDYYELLSLFLLRYGDKANEVLTTYLTVNKGGRLNLENGVLEYTVGRYFPTEFRPAASRVLATLIWKSFANEKDVHTHLAVYTNGKEMREAINRRVSTRVAKFYFN